MASSPSPLSPAEIANRLRAQFGDDIVETEDVHGHAVAKVKPERYQEVARFLRDDPALGFDLFDFLAAVDYTPKDGGFQVVAHLYSTTNRHNVRLKVDCDAAEPRCPTLSDVYPGANWHEREAAELFGVVFDGHPHLVKLLLPEQFEGHPLRKDFALMTREAKPWPGAAEGEEIEE
ncbi:MAG TPA: NADH-quinone oxidoreductase subunit C [Actinomycetota bacterium]